MGEAITGAWAQGDLAIDQLRITAQPVSHHPSRKCHDRHMFSRGRGRPTYKNLI